MRYSLYETTACKVSHFKKECLFFFRQGISNDKYTKKGVKFVDKKSLFMEIEQCRQEMLALSEEHGLDSEPVLSTSEKLDALIFAYLKKTS